jgi:hypothetical protein
MVLSLHVPGLIFRRFPTRDGQSIFLPFYFAKRLERAFLQVAAERFSFAWVLASAHTQLLGVYPRFEFLRWIDSPLPRTFMSARKLAKPFSPVQRLQTVIPRPPQYLKSGKLAFVIRWRKFTQQINSLLRRLPRVCPCFVRACDPARLCWVLAHSHFPQDCVCSLTR